MGPYTNHVIHLDIGKRPYMPDINIHRMSCSSSILGLSLPATVSEYIPDAIVRLLSCVAEDNTVVQPPGIMKNFPSDAISCGRANIACISGGISVLAQDFPRRELTMSSLALHIAHFGMHRPQISTPGFLQRCFCHPYRHRIEFAGYQLLGSRGCRTLQKLATCLVTKPLAICNCLTRAR